MTTIRSLLVLLLLQVCAGEGLLEKMHSRLLETHGLSGPVMWMDTHLQSYSGILGEKRRPVIACVPEEERSFLEETVGKMFVEVIWVDHSTGEECFLLQASTMNTESLKARHGLELQTYPPLLKLHESILQFTTTSHFEGVTKNQDPLGVNKSKTVVDFMEELELVVQFVPGSVVTKKDFYAIIEEWKEGSDGFFAPIGVMSDALADYFDATGKYARWDVLRRNMSLSKMKPKQLSCSLPPTAELAFSDSENGGCKFGRIIDLRNLWQKSLKKPNSNPCFVYLVEYLSLHSEVLSVSIDVRPKALNYNSRGLLQGGSCDNSPLTDIGLTGNGQIVGVSDTGLDDRSCFFYDTSGKYSSAITSRDGSLEENRRKVIQYTAGADAADGIGGHGTHVAGSIVGDSISAEFSPGNGVAPQAKVAFYDIEITGKSHLSLPSDVLTVYNTLYTAGARVLSNSWGGGNSYYYPSYKLDYFAYNHQDTLVIFAAGNSGANGKSSIIAPCLAKNSLCVGSVDATDDKDDSCVGGSSNSRVSYFSSLGPTSDGRIKPDVVAPGFRVLSAMAGNGHSRSCGIHDMFGTSMATPTVAGGALLIREYFSNNMWKNLCRSSYAYCRSFTPTGYLLKAVIIHSGQAVSSYSHPMFDHKTSLSSYSLSSTPDDAQGYGAVNLHSTLPLSKAEREAHDLYVSDRTYVAGKSTVHLDVSVNSNKNPLKVTLVWYDAPSTVGSSSTNLLILNLDLKVVSKTSQKVWYGNRRNRDTTNPQEQVLIASPSSGTYTIYITNTGSSSINAGLVVTCHGSVTQEPTSSSSSEMLFDDSYSPQNLDIFSERDVKGENDVTGTSSLFSSQTSGASTYEKTFAIDHTLSNLTSKLLGTFQIKQVGYHLESIDISLDSSYCIGSEAFIFAVTIAAPNGEVIQIGGHNQFSTLDRLWNRMGPVHFTQRTETYDGDTYYKYSRNVEALAINQKGTFKVYIGLMHHPWADTTYRGSVNIHFKVDTSSPTPRPTPRPSPASPTISPIEDESSPSVVSSLETGHGMLMTGLVLFFFTFIAVFSVALALVRRRKEQHERPDGRGAPSSPSPLSSSSNKDKDTNPKNNHKQGGATLSPMAPRHITETCEI